MGPVQAGGGGDGQPSAGLCAPAHTALCTLTPHGVAGPPGNWARPSVRQTPSAAPHPAALGACIRHPASWQRHRTPRFCLRPGAPPKQSPRRGPGRTPNAGWERGCRVHGSPVYSDVRWTLAAAPAHSAVLGWAVWGGRGQASPLPGAADPESLLCHPPSCLPLRGPLPTSPYLDAPASPRCSSNPVPSRQPSRLLPVRLSLCSGLARCTRSRVLSAFRACAPCWHWPVTSDRTGDSPGLQQANVFLPRWCLQRSLKTGNTQFYTR